LFAGILKVSDEKSRIRIQDPDPLVRGMDLRIRIRPKMSWIRNTDSQGAEMNWRKNDAVRRERAGLAQFEERNSMSAELAVLLAPEKKIVFMFTFNKKKY
jgi:hypothetical protein